MFFTGRESDKTIAKFGMEIGTADSLVKVGARVQFTNGKWYTNKDRQGSLPVEELQGEAVFAIDAKETDIDRFIMADVGNVQT